MNHTHIIVVEDDEKIAQILVDYLDNAGFKVTALYDGKNAVETIQKNKPDFVILDLMLPGKDGLSICKELRQFSTVPILMLTARVDEIDRLIGLETGADDYVCKPFLPREVVARVQTILRRVQKYSLESANDKIAYRGVVLSPDNFQCTVSEVVLNLTPVEFRLLKTLMTHPGRVYTRDNLIQSSYLDGRIVSDRTIDSHVKNVRKKLSDVMNGNEIIQTIYGVGYKLE